MYPFVRVSDLLLRRNRLSRTLPFNSKTIVNGVEEITRDRPTLTVTGRVDMGLFKYIFTILLVDRTHDHDIDKGRVSERRNHGQNTIVLK